MDRRFPSRMLTERTGVSFTENHNHINLFKFFIWCYRWYDIKCISKQDVLREKLNKNMTYLVTTPLCLWSPGNNNVTKSFY